MSCLKIVNLNIIFFLDCDEYADGYTSMGMDIHAHTYTESNGTIMSTNIVPYNWYK
jgi:hypothetical protein